MTATAKLISDFYTAFARRDHETMAGCYSDSATFSDPVFPKLDSDHVRAMWRMFCTRSADLAVTFSGVEADDRRGSAHWEATYTFSPTGRRVHNRIAAAFTFADGRIERHRDSFDFYNWARMALGPTGWVLGWTPALRAKVRKQAAAQLERFISDEEGRVPSSEDASPAPSAGDTA